ncbi:MAG: hypothetical protein ACLTM7_04740 [Streptococcus sp.]
MLLKQLKVLSQNKQAVNHHLELAAFSEAPAQQLTPQFEFKHV